MHEYVGYAIVSADGKIADAEGKIPRALHVEEDQRRFLGALDESVLVVLGRKGHIKHPSNGRRRLVASFGLATLAPDPTDPNATFWNPQGISIEDALKELDVPVGRIAVTGGQGVFGLFLSHYGKFVLAKVTDFTLPGGIDCFADGDPEEVLARAGLRPESTESLTADGRVIETTWSC